jgi:alpha-tubulin suppressor-like RCC1 family protein
MKHARDARSWLLVAACLSLSVHAEAATVAAGASHTVVVDGSGGVWTWGRNNWGQLGNGTLTTSLLPLQVSGVSGVVAVAAGEFHTLALAADGRVWAWGANYYGQVGDSSTNYRTSPVLVATGVTRIAAGASHSLALKSDGTVLSWGRNDGGQLGDGTTVTKTSPQVVPGLTAVAAIAAGGLHSLVVKADGSAWAWGNNWYGQVGDGTLINRTTPTAVTGLAGVSLVAVAGGTNHSLALGADGFVYGWGTNDYGQVGDGTVTNRSTPVRVAGIARIVAISAGHWHSGAVEDDGTPWGWGRGGQGELGTGSRTPSPFPVPTAPGPWGVVQLAASCGQHTMALTSDGTLWAWGLNLDGQIGDGTTLERLTPVKVSEPGFNWKVGTPAFVPVPKSYTTTQSVSLSSATSGATIRYTTDGTDPTASSAIYSVPIPVTATTTIKAFASKSGMPDSNVATGPFTLTVSSPVLTPGGGTYGAAQSVSMATSTAGAVIHYTTDGSPPTTASAVYAGPIAVTSSGMVMAIAVKPGWNQSFITGATYTLNYGTLAAPATSPAAGTYVGSVSVAMSAPGGATVRYTADGSNPTSTSAAYTAPILVTATQTLKATAFKPDWTESAVTSATYTIQAAAPAVSPGAGTYAMGQAITITCATPGATIYYTLDGTEPTTSDASIASGSAVFAGNFTLKARAYATGLDASATTSANYVLSGTPASGAVAAGAAHSLALKPNGELWTWGLNSSGQLGDGTTTQRTSPVRVTSLSGITAVAAGASHSLALKSDGTVWAFGSNAYGQLGVGAAPAQSATPLQITALSAVVAVAAGANHSLAITSDGRLWAWGRNSNGQLGDNTTANKNTPIQVSVPGVPAVAITAVAGGANHTLAVRGDGVLWAWGSNSNGQIGDGTTMQRMQPIQVTGLTGVSKVAGGGLHSLARKSDGSTWSWGYDNVGQLGVGSYTQYTSPQEVLGVTGAANVAAAASSSMALVGDWIVSTWGTMGLLGNGSTTHGTVPAMLWYLPPIVAIAAGDAHDLALGQDGSLWAWGTGTSGQIGDGTTVARALPVKVAEAGFVWKAATPTFNYAAGTYSSTFNVTVSTSTAGATLYYTTNGTTPTTSSPVYGAPIAITQTTTLQALAVKTGLANSNITSAQYTLLASNPGMSPTAGTYSAPQTVTLTSSTPGVTIRYTTNGQIPTEADPGLASGQIVSVSESLTLRASSWKSGWTTSGVSTASYTLKVATPVLAPNGGVYSTAQTVTVSTTTPGAVIHYTLNGLEPTAADPVVASGSTVAVAHSAMLRVKALRAGWTPSDTSSASFILTLGTAATPTFAPPAGTYTAAQIVTISTASAGAVVRYTVDGSDPSSSSPVFASPIPVQATTTIKARAYRVDLAASPVASSAYSISVAAVAAPTFGVASGVYTSRRTVTISCATAGATIRYTTNGLDPSVSDPTIASGGSLVVDSATIVKAAAWKAGMTTSAVSRRDYRITGSVTAGGYHTLVLKADGRVWSFGQNTYGQLGDNSTTQRTSPVQLATLTDVVAIAAGGVHSLALKSDGSVWSWGRNNYGQLGDATTVNKSAPVQVTGLSGAVAIAAGQNHSLALLSSGVVKAWGYNTNGQLGNNSTAQSSSPVTVSSLTTAAAIAAGSNHSIAVKTDGTMVAWGGNASGQLGVATPTQSLVPIAVPNLSLITSMAAGTSFSYAARPNSDGTQTLWAFGLNTSGQLGEGTFVSKTSPIGGPGDLRTFAAGERHGLAVRSNGRAIAWGANEASQLGDGSLANNSIPVSTQGPAEIIQTSAGAVHSIALRADGTLWVWGSGTQGQLGLGSTQSQVLPVAVPSFAVASNSWMNEDTDLDGLTNAAEYRLASDPLNPDTNADGVLDAGTVNPTDTDADADGLANWTERQVGTDPFVPDTDQDGVLDGADCYPLDSGRSACGSPVPGDTTPPVITLIEPPGAVPVP